MRVPKLSSDGSNFHIWRDKLILALRVRGLDTYLNNKATKPEDPAVRPPDERATAIPDEVQWGTKPFQCFLLLERIACIIGNKILKIPNKLCNTL